MRFVVLKMRSALYPANAVPAKMQNENHLVAGSLAVKQFASPVADPVSVKITQSVKPSVRT